MQLFCLRLLKHAAGRKRTFDLNASRHDTDGCCELWTFALCALIHGAWDSFRRDFLTFLSDSAPGVITELVPAATCSCSPLACYIVCFKHVIGSAPHGLGAILIFIVYLCSLLILGKCCQFKNLLMIQMFSQPYPRPIQTNAFSTSSCFRITQPIPCFSQPGCTHSCWQTS